MAEVLMVGGTFDELAPEDVPMAGATDQPAEAEAEEEAGAAGPTDGTGAKSKKKHSRLHTMVAISIATVSVLGAIASWRIEDHSTAASELDQSAVAATITSSRLTVEARATAQQSENDFFRYQRLSGEATQLAPAGCPSAPVTVLEFDAFVVCELADAVFIGGDDQYVSSNGQTYNVNALTRDIVAEQGFEQDHDAAPYQAEARADRHAEDRLLLLTLVLVLTLALLTVANLAHRRKIVLRAAIPAWLLMAVSAVLLVVWEA
ncbi:MAG TPA: hypothetical protein VG298_13260 [Acidimicrobiales bacterium]|nr:hypothetical protein [Acidimicrobiales bacterium]